MGERDFDAWLRELEDLWRSPDGPLFMLRQGRQDATGLDQTIQLLQSIEVTDADRLPRRLVALLWYMPTFMEWQLERVIEAGGDGDALRGKTTVIRNELERILGVP